MGAGGLSPIALVRFQRLLGGLGEGRGLALDERVFATVDGAAFSYAGSEPRTRTGVKRNAAVARAGEDQQHIEQLERHVSRRFSSADRPGVLGGTRGSITSR